MHIAHHIARNTGIRIVPVVLHNHLVLQAAEVLQEIEVSRIKMPRGKRGAAQYARRFAGSNGAGLLSA